MGADRLGGLLGKEIPIGAANCRRHRTVFRWSQSFPTQQASQGAQGELDFDNAIDANFDNVYEFSVTYTSGSNSVTENIKLTVTDTATPTSAANTATTNLTVKEGENITFEGLGTLGVFSDAMKEFVLADSGAGTGFAAIANTGDQQHFEIDSTGKVTVATGIFDFENPADDATAGSSDGTANNNIYQFTVVYTDGNNKTFTETINVTVTDDAFADAATSITTLEQALTASQARFRPTPALLFL